MQHQHQVHSRHTVFGYAFDFFVLVIGIFGLDTAIDWLRTGTISLEFPFVLRTGLGGLGGGLAGRTSPCRIDRAGIGLASLWGRRFLAWRDVARIRFQRDYFGGYTLHLYPGAPQPRHLRLFVARLGNGNRLGRASHEAGGLANPAIRFPAAHR